MKKHINALLGFVCYTIGVIAAAYYGLWKMLVLPLHTLAVSFSAMYSFSIVSQSGSCVPLK